MGLTVLFLSYQGPQYVCTNFSTFICTTCSGLHREFTHRVKSVSMAKFTPQEVSALQGGGNASAREIYLKEWDPQRNSLPDGSNIERLRDFIKHVYVDRRFTGERNVEKPPRAKMGETEDSNGNRRIDTYQGGSRSPPYDDRHSDRRSSGGRSPAYDQDNRQSSDYRRSPARAEVVTDWTREDRFGNGRRSEDRSSDGGSRLEIRSPDSQRDSDISSPPVVRPVRDILGDNVSPLRVIEPPKATGVKSTDGRAYTQRTASSSSLASSDANPSEVKVEASLIDFDAVPEPPVTVQQPPAAGNASSVQLAASNSNNWANFDSVPEMKTNTAPSNSVESLLSGLSIPASSSVPSTHLGNISPFQPSGSLGSSFGSSFGSTAIPPVGPTAPASSLGPAANVGGSLFINAPTGGQWPTMNPQQHSLFPGGINPSVSQLVTPVTGGSVSNKPWNPLAPNAHGAQGVPMQVGPAVGTSSGFKVDYCLDGQSGGRKALSEDLFTMNYSYPSPVSAWYPGSPYVGAVPMHYNAPMAVPNFQAVSRSSNPFDVGSEPSPLQAPTFPSMASLQGALPKAATLSGSLHTSNFGVPAHNPPSLHTQTPSYATTIPPSSFMGQEIAGRTAPRPQGLSGFSFEESPFASLNPNPPQVGGLHSAPSNFTPTSGNPFG
ncbi:hypothetical protein ACS0TY_021320 [Phlomoides rotata]